MQSSIVCVSEGAPESSTVCLGMTHTKQYAFTFTKPTPRASQWSAKIKPPLSSSNSLIKIYHCALQYVLPLFLSENLESSEDPGEKVM